MLSIIHAEVRYERDQGLYLHSGGVLPLGRVRAAGQPVLRRGADPRRIPVRALMGDPGKRGKALRPALSGTAPRSRQGKHLFSLDALNGEPEGRLLAEEVIRTEERNRVLHFCMDEMNPDYREVLYLTYFEGMSYAQAAEVTGKTVKQITNLVYWGKESLRWLLEREGITNAEP